MSSRMRLTTPAALDGASTGHLRGTNAHPEWYLCCTSVLYEGPHISLGEGTPIRRAGAAGPPPSRKCRCSAVGRAGGASRSSMRMHATEARRTTAIMPRQPGGLIPAHDSTIVANRQGATRAADLPLAGCIGAPAVEGCVYHDPPPTDQSVDGWRRSGAGCPRSAGIIPPFGSASRPCPHGIGRETRPNGGIATPVEQRHGGSQAYV